MNEDSVTIERLFELAASVSARSRRATEARLKAKGLTYAQYAALTALVAREGMSQAELSAAIETDSTTAMVLRMSLEKKGLVARSSDPEDGRIKRIIPTEAGKAALKAALPEAQAMFSGASDLVSEAECKRLGPVLERLAEYAHRAEAEASPKKALAGEPRRRGRPPKAAEAPSGSAQARGKLKKVVEPKKTVVSAEGKRGAKPAPAMAPKKSETKSLAKSKVAPKAKVAVPKVAPKPKAEATTKAKVVAKPNEAAGKPKAKKRG